MALKPPKQRLDEVIDEMIEVVKNSKDEIFHIGENARTEHNELHMELMETKDQVLKHIEEGDMLEKQVKLSRQQLSNVSKYFDYYTEEQIKEVYEKTHDMQTRLAILRQKEKALRSRRDELERRLVALDQTIKRGEGLVSKISVVLNYLNEDFKQVNEMIEEAKEKQEFGLQIIEAQEDERRKLSREIHDGPAQMLANILLRSELVDRTFRNGDVDQALAEIKSVRKMVRSSLYEVRRIIYDLRPMALDDLGLVPTLKKYLHTAEEYQSADIEFISIGREQRFNPKYEIAIFRLIQEAVQNANKHAKATSIQVKLEIRKDRLAVMIKDNGKGFDPTVKRDKSFGLMGMRERVGMLDGTLKIDSVIDEGTSIFINVPYNK